MPQLTSSLVPSGDAITPHILRIGVVRRVRPQALRGDRGRDPIDALIRSVCASHARL
jgi:hypothetical protein